VKSIQLWCSVKLCRWLITDNELFAFIKKYAIYYSPTQYSHRILKFAYCKCANSPPQRMLKVRETGEGGYMTSFQLVHTVIKHDCWIIFTRKKSPNADHILFPQRHSQRLVQAHQVHNGKQNTGSLSCSASQKWNQD